MWILSAFTALHTMKGPLRAVGSWDPLVAKVPSHLLEMAQPLDGRVL